MVQCVIEPFINILIFENIKKINNTNVVYTHMHAYVVYSISVDY